MNSNSINEYNYFEYAEALHVWLTLYHEGQSSDRYALLSRSQFKPGASWSESKVELDNPYYPEISYLNYAELFEELEDYLAKGDET